MQCPFIFIERLNDADRNGRCMWTVNCVGFMLCYGDVVKSVSHHNRFKKEFQFIRFTNNYYLYTLAKRWNESRNYTENCIAWNKNQNTFQFFEILFFVWSDFISLDLIYAYRGHNTHTYTHILWSIHIDDPIQFFKMDLNTKKRIISFIYVLHLIKVFTMKLRKQTVSKPFDSHK